MSVKQAARDLQVMLDRDKLFYMNHIHYFLLVTIRFFRAEFNHHYK